MAFQLARLRPIRQYSTARYGAVHHHRHSYDNRKRDLFSDLLHYSHPFLYFFNSDLQVCNLLDHGEAHAIRWPVFLSVRQIFLVKSP
jgi:hypothetical protein